MIGSDPFPTAPPAAFAAVETIAGNPAQRLLLLADHASNRLPPGYGGLGLPAAELERHIAYDIGAAALTRGLAARLGAPAMLAGFSRLLIDPNRGEDDPTLLMRLSDGAVVPGNARADAAERDRRIAAFYAPYHQAVAAAIAAIAARGLVPLILSVHSFTPVWRSTARPWQAALLWDADPRFAQLLIEGLRTDPALTIGDNEPYSGDLKNDTLYRHATRRGLPHALIEVRQDLIGTEVGVAEWTGRLAPLLKSALAVPELAEVRHFGSRTGPVDPLPPFPTLPPEGPPP